MAEVLFKDINKAFDQSDVYHIFSTLPLSLSWRSPLKHLMKDKPFAGARSHQVENFSKNESRASPTIRWNQSIDPQFFFQTDQRSRRRWWTRRCADCRSSVRESWLTRTAAVCWTRCSCASDAFSIEQSLAKHGNIFLASGESEQTSVYSQQQLWRKCNLSDLFCPPVCRSLPYL